jgi:hypothetical protein
MDRRSSRAALLRALTLLLALPAGALATGAPAQGGPAGAAGDPEPGRARILYVGVFHFDYPGLDVQEPGDRMDVLAPARQREIEELVELLAAYRPTRIAVEFTPDRQPRLDSLYAEYLEGRWELRRNEVYQLGFRLARMAGLPGVHAVDTERHPFFVDLAREQLAPRRDELFATDAAWRERFARMSAYEDSLSAARGETLREILLRGNSPEQLRRMHQPYSVGFFRFDGEEGGYLGADFVSGWYNRNLRIFRNLQRITRSPGERILFVVGSGHLPILRFVTEHSPEYELVEASDYLARGAGG